MKQIEIGKAAGFGWDSIKKDLWYFVGLAFVYMAINSLSSSSTITNVNLDFIGLFIGPWLTAGLTRIALDYYGGKKPPFETLFIQFKYFLRIFGSQILIGLIVVGGLILLIVPGIYWALKYQFVTNIIVDKNVGILDAMHQSGELTRGVKLQLLLFDFAMAGVMILGGLALGVGILVAFPIVTLAGIYVYKKLGTK
jgi:uncharacterized membrane protein